MKICLKEAFEISRFTKFCIIGAASFVAGFLVFNLSYIITGQLIFSLTVSYVSSIANGFFWNRHWTFKDRRRHSLWNQAARFICFYSVGYCINLVAYTFFLSIIIRFQHNTHPSDHFYAIAINILQGRAPRYSLLLVNIAGILATGITIIWNYLTNFFWAFEKT